MAEKITSSSTAEYFSKNLQQVGFSSPTKAVLTCLKEAVDNSLDACEDAGILPEVKVEIERKGIGTIKNSELIRISVEDNGPGLGLDDVARVFGEYLASSKFGRGRCSRGQQGIGISAATTWAQLTTAKGAHVITKTKTMKQASELDVIVDIKNNKGAIKNKQNIKWDKSHGLKVEFLIDGRMQLNGEGGLLTYLTGNALVNPHLTLHYKLPEQKWEKIERVTDEVPEIPSATEPHPHTMKLGEFIGHSHLFSTSLVSAWLKKGFSRISDKVIDELGKNGVDKSIFKKTVKTVPESDLKNLFSSLQKLELMAPSTRSVMTIGEDGLSKSIRRLGEVDFFAVVTRKPKICDFKPVAVEVAIARLKGASTSGPETEQSAVNVLRFANRVPLQFDKSGCAMYKAIETVNWKAYGLNQAKNHAPTGPYVIAISLVSPFIKFKNASKETVDASDELVEEIRLTLIQAGQRLSRHIRKENREADLEKKLAHIEQFCPILVDCLCRILKAPSARKKKATAGIIKLLGRDVTEARKDLVEAEKDFHEAKKAGKVHIIESTEEARDDEEIADSPDEEGEELEGTEESEEASDEEAEEKPAKKEKKRK